MLMFKNIFEGKLSSPKTAVHDPHLIAEFFSNEIRGLLGSKTEFSALTELKLPKSILWHEKNLKTV